MDNNKNELITVRDKNRFSEILNENLVVKFDDDDGSLEEYIIKICLSQMGFHEKLSIFLESFDHDLEYRAEGLEVLETQLDDAIENLRKHGDPYPEERISFFESLAIVETNKEAFNKLLRNLIWAGECCSI
jgi:hypothetical protein